MRWSKRGITQGAVRWNRCSRPTIGWIRGTNWIEEAPVPMTATRSPTRSWPWSHRAEWKLVPRNAAMPGSRGTAGSLSGPAADTRKAALNLPRVVVTSQRAVDASQRASRTSWW